MYKYLKRAYGIKAQLLFTEGKNHGIKAIPVRNMLVTRKIGFLIIPDASLGNRDFQFLNQWHINYLVIDHHDLNFQKSDLGNKLHIFNNQWNKTYINRKFTGVGLVYLFCKLLDRLNKTSYADKYLYLLSVGQVGDVSDISGPEVRHYVKEGFNQMISSELLKLTTATDRLLAHKLSFSIIPKPVPWMTKTT